MMEGHKDTLTFEEFSAVRRRQRNKGSQIQHQEASEEDTRKENRLSKRVNARPSASRSIFENLGVGLQSQEVQLFVVMITVMDICGLVAELYFESKRPIGAQEVPRSISELERVLQYIPVLSLFIYTVELLLLLFAFGGKIFSHSGYTTDCAILLLMGYGRFSGSDKILRLLNLARVWRIVRMVNARISAIEDEYVQSMSILETEVDRLQSLEVDLKATKSALKKEKDKAIRMEETFRSQREQLDTYSEALQIAAKTVAKLQEVSPDSVELVTGAISEAKSENEEADSDFEDTRPLESGSTIYIDEDGSYH